MITLSELINSPFNKWLCSYGFYLAIGVAGIILIILIVLLLINRKKER